jgi:hypothetical protein
VLGFDTLTLMLTNFSSVALLLQTSIFLSFPQSAAVAKTTECSEVRLDRNGSVKDLPVYDQGTDGICYAYTAVQLIDAWRFSHGKTPNEGLTSAVYASILHAKEGKPNFDIDADIDLARKALESGKVIGNLKFHKTSGKKSGKHAAVLPVKALDLDDVANTEIERTTDRMGSFEPTVLEYVNPDGGYTDSALRSLLGKKSVCSAESLFGPDAQKQFRILMEPLTSFGDNIRNKHHSSSCDQEGTAHKDDKVAKERQELEIAFRKVFSNAQINVLDSLDEALSKVNSPNGFILSLFDRACTQKVTLTDVPSPQTLRPPGNRNSKNFVISNIKEVEEKIDELLSHPNPQPIGINYNAAVLLKTARGAFIPHASIIIGRKMINGQCHVLIRNSIGRTCRGQDLEYRFPCEEGQIWIPVKTLSHQIENLIWL